VGRRGHQLLDLFQGRHPSRTLSVRRFTQRHPCIPEHLRGTYAGLAYPSSIEYLKSLGNFLTTILLSQGVPMILGGDEIGRTQQGNNNAYCMSDEEWQQPHAKSFNAHHER
jgi:pullulanase/glycogen debranching enzyme